MEVIDTAALLAAWDQFVADQKQRMVGNLFANILLPQFEETALTASQGIISAIERYNQYQPYFSGDTGKARLYAEILKLAQQHQRTLTALVDALLRVSRS